MSDAEPIRFACDTCGHSMKVAAKYAGRRAKCKGCGEPVQVPDLEADEELQLAEAINEDTGPSWLDALPAAETSPAGAASSGVHRADNDPPPWYKYFYLDIWIGICSLMIAFIWVCFFGQLVFGIDIFAMLGRSSEPADGPTSVKGLGIAAVVVSVLLGPIVAYRYVRTQALMTRGVMVPCIITKVGKIGSKGMVDATFEYTYEGKTYKPKISIADIQVDTITHLRVDPDYPKRCMAE